MKIALCAIAKNEDMYVDHWVKHYFDRGFDSITIYDNNDERDLVCKDLRVNIINAHKKPTAQMSSYEEFYKNNKDKFDWIAYFDLDEYIDCDDIKAVIQNLPNDINQLQIKLLNMSDSNLLHADYSISPFERFKEPAIFQWHSCKAIIKSNTDNIIFKSPHYFLLDFSHTYFPNGKLGNQELRSRFHRGTEYIEKDYKDQVVIHHCDMKTIEEYIAFKFNRPDAIYKDSSFLAKPIPDRSFFQHNVKTKEKLEILSQAPYNDLTDLILDKANQFDKKLLETYRKIYIKENTLPTIEDSIKHRVKVLTVEDLLDEPDIAEFYIENDVEKRKSIEQLKKYFS